MKGDVGMIKIRQIPESTVKKNIVVRLTAIILALFFSAILLAFLGHNPLEVYASMLNGSLGSLYRFQETIVRTIPLVITSLGVGLSFRMRFWNIGGEGQIMMGAFAATYVALFYPGIPGPLLLLLMALAGMLGAGLWALLPAFFKARFKTNETIFTLMMNYIALKWITYLQYGPWRDAEAYGYPKIPNFTVNAQLPRLLGIHIGWIVVPLLVTALFLFIRYTKAGFEINVIGESESAAGYAGMNVRAVILVTLFASGAICGLTGMIQVSGVNSTLSVDVSNGVGYTAIIISWLGQLNAVAILLVSFLFALLVEGGSYIQTVFHIPQAAALLIQGIILFFVLGSEFFIRYKVTLTGRPGSVFFPKKSIARGTRVRRIHNDRNSQFSHRRHYCKYSPGLCNIRRNNNREERDPEPWCGRDDVHGSGYRLQGGPGYRKSCPGSIRRCVRRCNRFLDLWIPDGVPQGESNSIGVNIDSVRYRVRRFCRRAHGRAEGSGRDHEFLYENKDSRIGRYPVAGQDIF